MEYKSVLIAGVFAITFAVSGLFIFCGLAKASEVSENEVQKDETFETVGLENDTETFDKTDIQNCEVSNTYDETLENDNGQAGQFNQLSDDFMESVINLLSLIARYMIVGTVVLALLLGAVIGFVIAFVLYRRSQW